MGKEEVPVPPQCDGFSAGDRGLAFRCSRRGHIEREGKHYCKQHDPVSVAERRQERDRKWNRQQQEQDARHARAEGYAHGIGIGTPHYVADTFSKEKGWTGGIVLAEWEARVLAEFVNSGPHMRDMWNRVVARVKATPEAQRVRRDA